MAPSTETNTFLQRPFYVFDLPPELLYSLTYVPRTQSTGQAPDPQVTREGVEDRAAPVSEDGVSQSTTCRLCGTSFNTVPEQRQHARSDFHRYNLKLSLKNSPAVDEATFVRMIGDLDDSISGSESSESEDDEPNGSEKDSVLSNLLRKRAMISHQQDTDGESTSTKRAVLGNAPILWMSSPKIGEDRVVGVYRAILSKDEQDDASTSLPDLLKKKQLTPTHAKHSGNSQATSTGPSHDPHYFLCMVGGGHFAAMVVSLVPEIRKGAGGGEERHAVVRAHKTFHRYTTRRKQGGSQSANDNSKGNAHSVGSSIRRANEAALEAEIRDILSQWRARIDSADLIFIRASGSANRRTLFGPYDGQVLNSRDERLRGFPFSTRRATQAELLRAFQELTRLKVNTMAEVAPEPKKTETPTLKPAKPKPQPVKLSQEEEAAKLHTNQLENLIRRSKAPGVLLYFSKNELSPDFRFFPPDQHHHAPTPLHLAASTNSPVVVTALLLKAKADPTAQNDDHKTPYELAGDQKTRDAFRIARYQLGENAFHWSSTHIPSGISQEEADTRLEQEQEANNAAESERRKADLAKISQEEEQRSLNRMERRAGAGKSIAEKTGAEKREEDTRGLTPEMRMKLERERRARAAEERIRKLQGGR